MCCWRTLFIFFAIIILSCTVKPVSSDHPRDYHKVVTFLHRVIQVTERPWDQKWVVCFDSWFLHTGGHFDRFGSICKVLLLRVLFVCCGCVESECALFSRNKCLYIWMYAKGVKVLIFAFYLEKGNLFLCLCSEFLSSDSLITFHIFLLFKLHHCISWNVVHL